MEFIATALEQYATNGVASLFFIWHQPQTPKSLIK